MGWYERGSTAIVCALVTFACLAAAADAGAAGLAPTKGSQLVTVYTSGPCTIGGLSGTNAGTFSQVVQPDGSVAPLIIPPKHILVLTDVTATTVNLTAGDVHFLQVVIGTPQHANSVAAKFVTAPASGVLTETFEFPTGLVVKSDVAACFQFADFTHAAYFVGFTAIGHGFIAPDR